MLTVHNALEFVSIMLGFVTFFIAWHGSIENNHNRIKIASIAILAASLFELGHLLYSSPSLLSQSNFAGVNYNSSWLTARLIWSGALLYAISSPLNCKNYTNHKLIIQLVLAILGSIIVSILLGPISWPFLYISQPHHPAIHYILYFAITIDLLSLLISRRYSHDYVAVPFLQAALIFSIIGNISFLIGNYALHEINFPAHLLKIFAYYFILLAVFKSVIKSPYEHLIALKEKLEELAAKNAKLYKESEQQRNLVEDTLAKIGTIISSQLNLKDTLDAIADMVADMMHARQSIIALLSNEQSHLQVVAAYGMSTRPTSLPLENSLSGQAISQNCPLFIGKIADYPDIFRPQLIFSSICSIICAPLVHEGQIIGVVEAYSSEIDAFSQHDALLLSALGHHAGAAIASAMLYEETKLRLEEEKYLSEIAQAAASSIDTDTILEQCTTNTVKALKADIGIGLIAVKDKNIMHTVTTINFDCKLSSIDLNSYPKLSLYVNNLKPATTTADIFPPIVDLYDQNAPRHLMVLPLTVNKRLLGLILLGWQRFVTPERLSRLSFASLVAQQIALGLDKAQLYNQVKSMALSDGLTGLANRRNFDMFIKTELRRAASLKRPLSLIMLDLDKFKTYNDTYGHLTGDKLLAQIGQILHHNLRNIDFPARYGGEEFSIILPECSSSEATALAENLRKVIENSQFPDNLGTFSARITASLGIATYDPSMVSNPPDMEKLIEVADKALYQAKQEGRNRVIGANIL